MRHVNGPFNVLIRKTEFHSPLTCLNLRLQFAVAIEVCCATNYPYLPLGNPGFHSSTNTNLQKLKNEKEGIE
jgi:hypothetical protein